MKKASFWNLPNSLTVLRMAVVPVMVWLLWEMPTKWDAQLAMAIFVAAMITDIIDGWLARKWNLVSVAGAFLDPLADKLMVATTMVMLVALGWLPAWVCALIICRELTITALRTVALSEGLHLPADSLGKFKTSFQSTALGFLLWHYPTEILPPTQWFPEAFIVDAHSCGLVLMYVAVFFTVVSAANYLRVFFAHARDATDAKRAES